MHSSRMRTGRSLTICRSLLGGGVSLVPGGSSWSRGSPWSQVGPPGPGGVSLVWGGLPGLGGIPACTEADPPVNRMTDTSKNITLAATSLRPVIKCRLSNVFALDTRLSPDTLSEICVAALRGKVGP